MRHIKLNAIDSTNDFLKDLAQREPLANFTAVTAQAQGKGRGQQGASWLSEPGKNLIMSVLIKDVLPSPESVFVLNVAVSRAVIQALSIFDIPDLSVKWPNDILSGDKKIAGILIENRIKSAQEIESVVGIGLNVNQTDFAGLPQAASLALVTGKAWDIDAIFEQLMVSLQRKVSLVKNGGSAPLWQEYLENLYQIGQSCQFENAQGKFRAVLKGVSPEGQLELLLQDQSLVFYGVKEVRLLY